MGEAAEEAVEAVDCRALTTWLTQLYWALCITVVWASEVVPWLGEAGRYGKCRPAPPAQSRARATDWTVPKSWFKHMYWVAVVWALALAALLAAGRDPTVWLADGVLGALGLCLPAAERAEPVLAGPQTQLTLAMFLVHVARRLWESHAVSSHAPQSRMHLAVYLGGLAFYMAAPWSLVLEAGKTPALPPAWRVVPAIALFACAELEQLRAHRILAQLRARPEHRGAYRIPYGGLFQVVSSPHYLAEILAYVAILLLKLDSTSVALLVAFVCSNLAITASATHQWYRSKFDDYPAERRALLPWLF